MMENMKIFLKPTTDEESLDLPHLVCDDLAHSDSGDSVDDNWTADEEPTICLFCEQSFFDVEAAINHLTSVHSVNFAALKARHQMDQYSFLKLINCIRSEKTSAHKVISATEAFWDDEKYLKPQAYEPWLSYDYDDMIDEVEAPSDSEKDLRVLVASLQKTVEAQALLLEQATEDMNKMRIGFQRMVDKESLPLKCISVATPKADEGYFNSYAHFGIHHEMLSDVVRTTSYRNALLNNKDFVFGKDVLDLGCGTSVLSIFSSQAGAKIVVGIDNSDIIYNAMDIVKNNGILNVSLVKGRLEDTALPHEKYDIIISEWMGYFLLFEGMLDSVIYARDHHLKEGGMLLPNRCTMSLLGYGNEELFKSHVLFWDNVYGLNMSNMRREVLHEPLIAVVDPIHNLTESEKIADLDLFIVNLDYSNFSYNFNLKCTNDGKFSAFVGYFDAYFDLPNPVMFGTAPTDEPTHWKQVVFFLDQEQTVKTGEIVNGKVTCKRSDSSARSLDIIIEAFGKKYKYYLD